MLCFDPSRGRPAFALPPGAVDAHCHVFGPGEQFPYSPVRKYTPCDASKEQLFALRDWLGFSRNVVVQAACRGTDNRAMIDALVHSNSRARGVASVGTNVTRRDLAMMHNAGVRGARFNYVKHLVDPKPDTFYRGIIDKIAEFGWRVVVYFEATDLEEKWDFMTSIPTDLVVDHMGIPKLRTSPKEPDFTRFHYGAGRQTVRGARRRDHGLIVGICGFIAYAFVREAWQAFSAMSCIALQDLVQPSLMAMLSRRATTETQGEVQGISSMAMGVGSIVGPLVLTAPLAYFTSTAALIHVPGAAFIVATVAASAALVLLRCLPRAQHA